MFVPTTHQEKLADAFSHEVWGRKTDKYVKSLCTLTEDEWKAIIQGSESALGALAGTPDDKGTNDLDSEDDDDERAHI